MPKNQGVPANVAACIAKLGGQASAVAAVGDAPFGECLLQEVNNYGANTDHVSTFPMSTTFAYVSLTDNGEREFAFSRGADQALVLGDCTINELAHASILQVPALVCSKIGVTAALPTLDEIETKVFEVNS